MLVKAKQEIAALKFKIAGLERELRRTGDELMSAFTTIDAFELLGKQEDTIRADIRILYLRRNQLIREIQRYEETFVNLK